MFDFACRPIREVTFEDEGQISGAPEAKRPKIAGLFGLCWKERERSVIGVCAISKSEERNSNAAEGDMKICMQQIEDRAKEVHSKWMEVFK